MLDRTKPLQWLPVTAGYTRIRKTAGYAGGYLLSCFILTVALGPLLGPAWDVLDLITLSSPPSFDSKIAEELQFNGQKEGELEKVVVPSIGEKYGKLVIASAGIDAPLYYGDDAKTLRQGIGTYTGTYLPGQRRTILAAAHNNRHFRTLGQVKEGDKIEVFTTYGDYVYEITGYRVAKATDKTAYDLTKQEENLILYTCYPFSKVGFKTERFFVYAKYVSGPQVIQEAGDTDE